MSDLDKHEWELGMELPSRKETHSKKKRKKEEQPEPELPPEVEHVVEEPEREPVEESEAEEESEPRPFLTTWQWWLFMTFTPILLLFVLAYGKLAYIHDVPDSVRAQVDAYEAGPAFLVVKPWWFGPPVFSLEDYKVPENDYARTADDHFRRYKIELGNFSGIVEDPWVLYRFPKDYLK